jgi:hypothetical protein
MDRHASTRPSRRSRPTPAGRACILEDFARSGLSKSGFAARGGISAWTLHRWLSASAQSSRDATARSRKPTVQRQVFDPLPASPATSSRHPDVVIRDPITVRVSNRLDADERRRLLALLRESC